MSVELILMEFAENIQRIDKEKFESKFVSIYNELVKYYNISGALKAGSYGKGTIVDLKGDLDIIFTIDNPEFTDVKEFRDDLARRLRQSFPYDHVERINRSVFIKFRNNLSVDVVYLSRNEFDNEKGQIKHVQNINEKLKNIIALIKYWKINKKKNKIQSYKIEWNTIYSSKTDIKERIINSIAKFGLNKQACQNAYDFIFSEALRYHEEIYDD